MVAYWLQDAKMAAKTQKMVDENKKTSITIKPAITDKP